MLEKTQLLIAILDQITLTNCFAKTYLSYWSCDIERTIKFRVRTPKLDIRGSIRFSNPNFDKIISNYIEEIKTKFL